MKQLDEELLLSLGFIKNVYSSIPTKYLYSFDKYNNHCTIVLDDKNKVNELYKGIYIYTNDIIVRFNPQELISPLYLEQLSTINYFLFCTGLLINDEILKRNGYTCEGISYTYNNNKFKCRLDSFRIIAYNDNYRININSYNEKIYCSYLDLVYKLLGEENKRIW